MMNQENCAHTPSHRRTLAGRFLDHFLNGETPHAQDDRVLCAKCGAEITHPEACLHPAVRIACLCGSAASGLLVYGLLQGLMAARWPYAALALLMLAVAAGAVFLMERAVSSFVLAAFPWQKIECAPEDAPLHRTAAAAERVSLKRKRNRRRFLNALQVCTVLLLGAEGGGQVMLLSGAVLIMELATRRERPVLLAAAAALVIGLLTTLCSLPTAALLLLNAAALTIVFGVTSLVLEERIA